MRFYRVENAAGEGMYRDSEVSSRLYDESRHPTPGKDSLLVDAVSEIIDWKKSRRSAI